MKKYLLIALTLIIVIAAVTNPSKQVHQEKVKEKFFDAYNSGKIGSDNVLDGMLVNNVVDQVTTQYLRVDNYLLFSVAKVKTDTINKRIGFGAFGNVFIDIPEDFLKVGKESVAIENEGTGANVKADDYYENDDAIAVSTAIANTALNVRDSVPCYNERFRQMILQGY